MNNQFKTPLNESDGRDGKHPYVTHKRNYKDVASNTYTKTTKQGYGSGQGNNTSNITKDIRNND